MITDLHTPHEIPTSEAHPQAISAASPRGRSHTPVCLNDEVMGDGRRILEAAIAILAQGEELLSTLPTDVYTQRVSAAFNGSVGGHYRHCLDHFTSLLQGLEGEMVDYDHRDRDTRIESQPAYALELTLIPLHLR